MDMTNFTNLMSTTDSMPPGHPEEKSTVKKLLIIITLSSIIVTAAVGNLLVCIAVVIERSLRRGTYFLIASLAVVDLLCAVLSMPFALCIALHGHWVFGAVYCRIWIASDVALCTASILHLCPIALDRYMSICHSTRYAGKMTIPRTVAFIAGIWAWSLLVAYVLVTLGCQKPDNEGSGSPHCHALFHPVYTIVNTIISFYVPCIVLLVIYTKLFVYVFMHQRKMRLHDISSLDRSTASASQSMTFVGSSKAWVTFTTLFRPKSQGSGRLPYKRTELKIAISLTAIAGSFMVCWVPFFSAVFAEAVNGTFFSPLTFQVLTWLGYSNCCINPVVYAFFTKPFRRAFRRMFCRRRCCGDSGQSRPFRTDRSISNAVQTRLNVTPASRSGAISLATNSGKGTLPLATDSGSGTLPLATDSASGTLPVSTDSRSGTVPLATDSGSDTLPLATDSEGCTLPLATDSESSTLPVPTDCRSGTLPLAADSGSATLPLATESGSGTLPLATDSGSETSLLLVLTGRTFDPWK